MDKIVDEVGNTGKGIVKVSGEIVGEFIDQVKQNVDKIDD